MNRNSFKCVGVGVDCVENTQENINNGGPEYLGFDFFVKEEEKEEMLDYIEDVLMIFGIPFQRIYEGQHYNLSEKEIWTKERIYDVIEKNVEFLQDEKINRNIGLK